MPKNTKKEQIKEAIREDELTLVEIANQFGVKQPYISQDKVEVERDTYFDYLKNLYSIMNNKMSWKERPTPNEVAQIKEVQKIL